MLSPRGSAHATAAAPPNPAPDSNGHDASLGPTNLPNGWHTPSLPRTSAAGSACEADPAHARVPSGGHDMPGTSSTDAAEPVRPNLRSLANGPPNGHLNAAALQAAPLGASSQQQRHSGLLSSADNVPPDASQVPSASSMSSKSEPHQSGQPSPHSSPELLLNTPCVKADSRPKHTPCQMPLSASHSGAEPAHHGQLVIAELHGRQSCSGKSPGPPGLTC